MIGKLNINGHIGDSFVDAKGQFHKGTNLLDVIEQCETYPDATQLEVSINSPGGFVDVGDAIYDYLLSLKKKGKTITTIQTGLIGSIATKLFLAGDHRIVDDRYKFWIHNPFQENVSGDQDALRAAADAVGETEKQLRKFYAEFTQITDEGLDGLMKIETGLTADQCIKFKFATEKKLVPVFNTINPINKKMKPEEKSLKEQLLALLGVKGEEVKKGVQPKAQIPANTEAKSLVVNLADGGGSFYVEGEVLAEGAGAFALDAEGQPTADPVADGDYKLEDGSMVSVAGGKVSKLVPAMEEEEPAALTQEAVDAKVAEAVAAVEAKFDEKILALKKGVSLGVQPKKAVMAKIEPKEETFKTISQIQLEREQAKKKTR